MSEMNDSQTAPRIWVLCRVKRGSTRKLHMFRKTAPNLLSDHLKNLAAGTMVKTMASLLGQGLENVNDLKKKKKRRKSLQILRKMPYAHK